MTAFPCRSVALCREASPSEMHPERRSFDAIASFWTKQQISFSIPADHPFHGMSIRVAFLAVECRKPHNHRLDMPEKMDYQKEFLRQTALFNATGAAFQRAGIYTKTASSETKDALKADLEERLCDMEKQYRDKITSQEHFQNIQRLAEFMSSRHARILREECFRVGVAQKALNIYLKLIWCYGWIPEPPHCPLDSIVLAEIGDTKTKWTKMHGIGAYRIAIEAVEDHVRQHAPGKSLSRWELEIWTNRTRRRIHQMR